MKLTVKNWFLHLKQRDFKWKKKLISALPIFLCVIGIDIVTKQLAIYYLKRGVPVPLIPGFLHLQRTVNPGVAFGAHFGSTAVMMTIASVIVLIATGVVLYSRSWVVFSFSSVVLGGATGNLTDRWWNHGQVVDFIFWELTTPHTIFNFADFFITSGLVCLIGGVLLEYLVHWQRARREEQAQLAKTQATGDPAKTVQVVCVPGKTSSVARSDHSSLSPFSPKRKQQYHEKKRAS